MALKGTLTDLGIVDLIQFPHAGRKTGLMAITGPEGAAKVFYENGALVHATLNDLLGMDALVAIVGWGEGSFEFEPGHPPEARSIDLDLHRAVMQALKLHDELKMEEEKRKKEEAGGPGPGDEALSAKLAEFVATTEYALHACVLSSDGKLKASADGSTGRPDKIDRLREALHAFVETYPRDGLNRALLDDEQGIVALVRLPDGGCLIVVAKKEASLGAVSVSIGRLALGLE
ncbi:MAG: DUF4388 domain-containing protein [Thermodesulfobacteriota bacterium]